MAILQVKKLIHTYAKGGTTVTALRCVSFGVYKSGLVVTISNSQKTGHSAKNTQLLANATGVVLQ